MAKVAGIDTSHWNGQIDWAKVRAAGQRFCFQKATEGNYYQDDTFAANWQGCKANGILRGAYHFYKPEIDARTQARYFAQFLQGHEAGELPPVLDMEVTTRKILGFNQTVPRAEFIAGVEAFLQELENLTGKKAIIYSNWNILNNYFLIPAGTPPLWVSNYWLWIAQYPNPGVVQDEPLMPAGWTRWVFWQHSKTGSVNGINGNVDLDWFNGSEADLFALAGRSAPVEGGAAGPSQPSGGVISTPVQPTVYKMKSGDTLTSVAQQFGVDLNELVRANPQLTPAGTNLSIPGQSAGTQPATPTASITHTVRAGDTLYAIALRYNTTVEAIVQLNNLANPDLIQVGQVLKIPRT